MENIPNFFMNYDEAKEEIDILYEEYFKKFEHKDPNKKQWYAIQMVTNVVKQRELNMIEEKIKRESFLIPDFL